MSVCLSFCTFVCLPHSPAILPVFLCLSFLPVYLFFCVSLLVHMTFCLVYFTTCFWYLLLQLPAYFPVWLLVVPSARQHVSLCLLSQYNGSSFHIIFIEFRQVDFWPLYIWWCDCRTSSSLPRSWTLHAIWPPGKIQGILKNLSSSWVLKSCHWIAVRTEERRNSENLHKNN